MVKSIMQLVGAIVVVVLVLAGIWLIGSYSAMNGGVRLSTMEAELKANMHNIQLSIERYGVDHEAAYPRYLIGGAASYSAAPDPAALEEAAAMAVDPAAASDPLIRAGYLTEYPHNPFVRNQAGRKALYDLQAALDTSVTGDDPLRNGPGAAGELRGTRFGADCRHMGQVLCDPRAEKFSYTDPASGEERTADSWAIVEYRAWDMWAGNRPDNTTKHHLPGQFLYKATGMASWDDYRNSEHVPPIPTVTNMYILGVYGSARTKGKDIIGEEFSVPYMRTLEDGESKEISEFWTWTRSQISEVERQGSPLWMSNDFTIEYSCPNGIRDGLILVLTTGEDSIGER